MLYSKLFKKGASIFMTLVFGSLVAFAQGNLNLSGNVSGSGTINVKGNITNNAGAPVTVQPILQMNGTGAGTQIVSSSVNPTDSIAFTTLRILATKNKQLSVGIKAMTALNIGFGGTDFTGTFDIQSERVQVDATSAITAGSNGATLSFGSGTLVFAGGSAQTVFNRTAGLTFGTLQFSGAGAKDLASGGTVTVGTLSHAGGALTVSENMTVNTAITAFGTLADVSSGKAFAYGGGAASLTTVSNVQGTLSYTGTNTLTIGTLSANAGVVEATSTGALEFTNAAASNGTIRTTGAGTLRFVNNLSGTGTLTLASNSFAEFGGSVAQSTYNFNASNATVTYNGAAQAVVPTTYANLVLDGSAGKTAASGFTVGGNLTLNQNLAQTGVLTMTSTTAANVTGTGYIEGSVRRNHAFTSGENYRFNAANIYIGTATQAGSDITLDMSLATSPISPASSKYANRNYAITPTVAGNLEALQLVYDTGTETVGGLNASRVGARSYNGSSWSKVFNTGQTRSSAAGVVTYSGLNNSLSGVNELGLFNLELITAANGADISVASGWDENVLATSDDDVVINNTGVTLSNASVSVASLTINAGNDLTVNSASGTLTVANDVTNAGTFTVTNASDTVRMNNLSVSGAGSISLAASEAMQVSSTMTYGSSASSTVSGSIAMDSLSLTSGTLALNGDAAVNNNINMTAGTLNVGGTMDVATALAATVSLNGTVATTGTGTLNIGASGIAASNLTMASGSLTVNSGTNLNVFGDLTINSGASIVNDGTITVGE